MGETTTIGSGSLCLSGYLARPSPSAAKGAGRSGLVLCHGFPGEPRSARLTGQNYTHLADRVAADAGWVVLTFNFRGTDESEGDFSLGGWLADINAAIDHLLSDDAVEAAWLCGFSVGGSLCLCAAGEDERARGVASFAAPADFDDWVAADPRRFVSQARNVGVITSPSFPPDLDAWRRELAEIRPLSLIGKIPPRPILLVHGANDDIVSMLDARALADAANGAVELRVLHGAGHGLRHDPRRSQCCSAGSTVSSCSSRARCSTAPRVSGLSRPTAVGPRSGQHHAHMQGR
jgi:pimeloyl-ACP methyl ester carboxylesterase